MIEFDATIRAMGLYKYLIYALERARIIAAIKFNQGELKRRLGTITYYRKNIEIFGKQLRENDYQGWDTKLADGTAM